MKTFLLFILFAGFAKAYGQADQWNEFFKQYGDTSQYYKALCVAVQETKELIASPSIGAYSLVSIKWKDIDSVEISDEPGGLIRATLHGKLMLYKRCDAKTSNYRIYHGIMYCRSKRLNRIVLFFRSDQSDRQLAISEKLRQVLRNAFHQLTNCPIREHYRPKPILYDSAQNAIIREDLNTIFLDSSIVRNAQKLLFRWSSNPDKFSETVSFQLYISRDGVITEIQNSGAEFSEEVKNALKNATKGSFFIFVNIRISGPDGVRTVEDFTVMIK